MKDKYEGRYFLEDKEGYSYIRGSFCSIEKAKQYAIEKNYPYWRVTAYDHNKGCWVVLLTSENK